MKNKRIEYMDIAKAFGIIAVVVGHSRSPFINFIYQFHMALFFFISGFLYKEKYSKEPIEFFIRKVRSLYIPFVAFEMVYLVCHNLFIKIGIYNNISYEGIQTIPIYNTKRFIEEIKKIITFDGTEQLAGAFWFFTSLFTVNILFCSISFLLKNFSKTNREIIRGLFVAICFITGNLIAEYNIYIHRYLGVSLVAMLIFYLGYLYQTQEAKIIYNKYIFLCCFIVLIINSKYVRISMGANSYTSPFLFLLSSILGIYCILFLSKLICNTSINISILKFIGRSTVSIMALHFLVFKLINLLQIHIYKYPGYMLAKFPVLNGNDGWWIPYTITGIMVPCLLSYVVRKCKRFFFI